MDDHRKIKGADSISNLPDEILQHILCFIPTKISISTSLLSRRWRHVWCDVPSISLDVDTMTAASVNETLARYAAPNTKSFHLAIKPITENKPYIDRLIKFAMSHSVENLSLDLCSHQHEAFEQLNIDLGFSHMVVPPQCIVSWTSLQKLSLTCCRLSDDSMAKILSGCPVLEYLTLYNCDELEVLDLSESTRLRTLDVKLTVSFSGPKQIVAPHIHSLRLLYTQTSSCTLVDVDSLTEAKLEILSFPMKPYYIFDPDYLQVMVLKMLETLQNTEKLMFGGNFIKILSLAEIRGVAFPMLKVKSLTLDTKISQYAIPGMERLLQNSPDLEKLTVCARSFNTLVENKYLNLEGFNLNTCWRSKDGSSWNKCCLYGKSMRVASLVELVLKNTKKLDKMVVLLDEFDLKFKIKDVVVPKLPRNKNVNVVLSTTKLMALEKW